MILMGIGHFSELRLSDEVTDHLSFARMAELCRTEAYREKWGFSEWSGDFDEWPADMYQVYGMDSVSICEAGEGKAVYFFLAVPRPDASDLPAEKMRYSVWMEKQTEEAEQAEVYLCYADINSEYGSMLVRVQGSSRSDATAKMEKLLLSLMNEE